MFLTCSCCGHKSVVSFNTGFARRSQHYHWGRIWLEKETTVPKLCMFSPAFPWGLRTLRPTINIWRGCRGSLPRDRRQFKTSFVISFRDFKRGNHKIVIEDNLRRIVIEGKHKPGDFAFKILPLLGRYLPLLCFFMTSGEAGDTCLW